jgi:hypothetical protein
LSPGASLIFQKEPLVKLSGNFQEMLAQFKEKGWLHMADLKKAKALLKELA